MASEAIGGIEESSSCNCKSDSMLTADRYQLVSLITVNYCGERNTGKRRKGEIR